ncbi:hypothetical protein Tco_0050426, partial [Tanacetum coccineum]
IEKFHKIMEERLVLVRTLTDGVAKFEHVQAMLDFCKEYKQTFNDAEFNFYESSNDEDTEGDVDGDNDKNNSNDDDGAPTTNANKKKESENQKKKRNKEEIDKQTEESDAKIHSVYQDLQIFSKFLTTRVTGWDQPPLQIMQMMYCFVNNIHVDYAELLCYCGKEFTILFIIQHL